MQDGECENCSDGCGMDHAHAESDGIELRKVFNPRDEIRRLTEENERLRQDLHAHCVVICEMGFALRKHRLG